MTTTRVRIAAALVVAAAGGAALSGCATRAAAAPLAAEAAGVQQIAAKGSGCAPNRAKIPKYSDVSSIGDVDGDGRADRQFHSLHSGVYGIRTASGATIVLHDNLPAPNQHGGWTARTETGVYTVIDDGTTAEVFRFQGCRFVPAETTYGLPFLSHLSDGGTGPAASDQVRYGVGCTDQNGGVLLANSIAIKQDDGTWELDWYVIQRRAHGALQADSKRSIAYSSLPATDRRVQHAGGSWCGTVPKAVSDGR